MIWSASPHQRMDKIPTKQQVWSSLLEIVDLRTNLIGPVNLSVADGECIAISGLSGSGKSLLLRAVADLDLNEGDIRLNGRSRNRMPAYEWRRAAALVPAESGWWADRVRDHFQPHPDISGLLEAVGLGNVLEWEVSRMSTGERQRAAIIRALQTNPQLLMLDEPTSALDADSTQSVERLLKDRLATGVMIILVTHDLRQADRLASRRFIVSEGLLRPYVHQEAG